TDIKRVIAYSTMSQIGYMFLGVGLGAYASGMFHLMTHAFFKALLFLAAGIVIHALAGEQDIRKMGGLRSLMPKTYVFFLVGATLAGWLQVPGGWAGVSNWLRPVAGPLVETTNTQEAIASIVSVVLGLIGVGIAWWLYVARRRPAPAAVPAFERKFWFDELY